MVNVKTFSSLLEYYYLELRQFIFEEIRKDEGLFLNIAEVKLIIDHL